MIGFFKSGNAVTQIQINAIFADVCVKHSGHFRVERCHDLICRLDQGDRKAGVMKVFGHFQTDEAAADDGCRFCVLLLDSHANSIGVIYRPQRLDAVRLNPGNRGTQRGRAGCDHQCVIRLFIHFAGFHLADGYDLFLAVDRHDFVSDADINVEFLFHRFRGLY